LIKEGEKSPKVEKEEAKFLLPPITEPKGQLSPVQRRNSTGANAKVERVIKMDGGLQGSSDENLLSTL